MMVRILLFRREPPLLPEAKRSSGSSRAAFGTQFLQQETRGATRGSRQGARLGQGVRSVQGESDAGLRCRPLSGWEAGDFRTGGGRIGPGEMIETSLFVGRA